MPSDNSYNLKKIIIVGIIILLIAGIAGFLAIRTKKTGDSVGTTIKNIFPFGDTTQIPQNQEPTDGTIDPNIDSGENNSGSLTTTSGERLRQITKYPVTNFISFLTNIIVNEPKLDEKTGEMNLISRLVPTDIVRFNKKEDGILIDAEVTTDSIIATALTSTKIPNAEEVWFGASGNELVYRYWNTSKLTIDSFTASLPGKESLSFCTSPLTKNLQKGDKNVEVKELQNYIKQKLGVMITADGSYGPKTETLVKQLQVIFKIPETGSVDVITRDAINNDCLKIQQEFAKQNGDLLKISGKFLEKDIIRGVVSPDKKELFFLIKTSSGVVGIISRLDGTGQRKIFESPFTEWMPQWINDTTITMTTLASREANGFLYFLNTTTGSFKKVLGPARGLLTNTSPDGATVLYSVSSDQGFVLKTYHTATGKTSVLDLQTLPQKCTWKDSTMVFCGVPNTLVNANYPDMWYQGLVSFSDTLWSINTLNSSTSLITELTQNFDLVKPLLGPNNRYLYFINKADETLWSYRLE